MQSGIKTASEVLDIIKKTIVCFGGFEWMYTGEKIKVKCREGYAYMTEAEFLKHFDGGKTLIPFRTMY